MIYYNLNHFNDTDQKLTINYFIVSITIICRRCKKSFVFNNKFYRYIREIDCFNVEIRLKKIFTFVIFNIKKFVAFVIFDILKFSVVFYIEKFFIVSIYVVIVSFVNVTKTSFELIVNLNVISIVISNVDVFKNIKIDCDYRDWNYAKIEVAFLTNVKLKFVCMNIDFEIIFANQQFFYRQNFNVLICIIITLFIVRNINFDQH